MQIEFDSPSQEEILAKHLVLKVRDASREIYSASKQMQAIYWRMVKTGDTSFAHSFVHELLDHTRQVMNRMDATMSEIRYIQEQVTENE